MKKKYSLMCGLALVFVLVSFIAVRNSFSATIRNRLNQRLIINLSGGRMITLLATETAEVTEQDMDSPHLRCLIEQGSIAIMASTPPQPRTDIVARHIEFNQSMAEDSGAKLGEIRFVVVNDGDTNQNVGVRIEIDGTVMLSTTVQGLAAGAERTVSTQQVRLEPGIHIVRGIVDTNQRLGETNEGNNIIETNYNIPPVMIVQSDTKLDIAKKNLSTRRVF